MQSSIMCTQRFCTLHMCILLWFKVRLADRITAVITQHAALQMSSTLSCHKQKPNWTPNNVMSANRSSLATDSSAKRGCLSSGCHQLFTLSLSVQTRHHLSTGLMAVVLWTITHTAHLRYTCAHT